eukprot:scaffold30156_cov65-Phaeocystis_antarctica.AAC.6
MARPCHATRHASHSHAATAASPPHPPSPSRAAASPPPAAAASPLGRGRPTQRCSSRQNAAPPASPPAPPRRNPANTSVACAAASPPGGACTAPSATQGSATQVSATKDSAGWSSSWQARASGLSTTAALLPQAQKATPPAALTASRPRDSRSSRHALATPGTTSPAAVRGSSSGAATNLSLACRRHSWS